MPLTAKQASSDALEETIQALKRKQVQMVTSAQYIIEDMEKFVKELKSVHESEACVNAAGECQQAARLNALCAEFCILQKQYKMIKAVNAAVPEDPVPAEPPSLGGGIIEE
jgi:hypothetical protein